MLQLVPNALLVPTALLKYSELRSLVGAVGIEFRFASVLKNFQNILRNKKKGLNTPGNA